MLKRGAEANLDAALRETKLFAIGASWGGTHSLIAPMNIASERTAKPWTGGAILRINIGLEDENDMWEELSRLLRVLERGSAAA